MCFLLTHQHNFLTLAHGTHRGWLTPGWEIPAEIQARVCEGGVMSDSTRQGINCQTPAAGKRPRGAGVLNFLNPLCGFNSVTQTFPTGMQKTCSTLLFWLGQNINFLLGFWWWRLKDRLKKNWFRGVWASGSGYLLPPTINRNLNYSFKATWVVLLQFARSGPRAQPE